MQQYDSSRLQKQMVLQYPLHGLAEIRSEWQRVTEDHLLSLKHIQQDRVFCPSLQNFHRPAKTEI